MKDYRKLNQGLLKLVRVNPGFARLCEIASDVQSVEFMTLSSDILKQWCGRYTIFESPFEVRVFCASRGVLLPEVIEEYSRGYIRRFLDLITLKSNNPDVTTIGAMFQKLGTEHVKTIDTVFVLDRGIDHVDHPKLIVYDIPQDENGGVLTHMLSEYSEKNHPSTA